MLIFLQVISMNRLKELREDKDLYQKDIADYLKIDQSNYSKHELEKNKYSNWIPKIYS